MKCASGDGYYAQWCSYNKGESIAKKMKVGYENC
jgi:hypothetical protein